MIIYRKIFAYQKYSNYTQPLYQYGWISIRWLDGLLHFFKVHISNRSKKLLSRPNYDPQRSLTKQSAGAHLSRSLNLHQKRAAKRLGDSFPILALASLSIFLERHRGVLGLIGTLYAGKRGSLIRSCPLNARPARDDNDVLIRIRARHIRSSPSCKTLRGDSRERSAHIGGDYLVWLGHREVIKGVIGFY